MTKDLFGSAIKNHSRKIVQKTSKIEDQSRVNNERFVLIKV